MLLLPDHIHVTYLLPPDMKIIGHAKNPVNHDPKDYHACERLTKKLMEQDRGHLEAKLIDTCLSELHVFSELPGPFCIKSFMDHTR